MPENILTGWLKDKNGDKFAPKTLTSQIQSSDGTLLEDKYYDKQEVDAKFEAFTPSSTPDWGENDPSAPGYIAGRTHYEEPGKVIVPLTTFSCLIDEFTQLPYYNFNNTFIIDLDSTYNVIFDGVEYNNLKPQELTFQGINFIGIGNGTIAGGAGNDEPFGVAYIINFDSTGIFCQDLNEHSVKITKNVVHKLDKKYIPSLEEMRCEEGKTLFNDTITADENNEFTFETADAIIAGNTYKINLNGVEYINKAIDANEITNVPPNYCYFLGNVDAIAGVGNTGEPYAILHLVEDKMSMLALLDDSTTMVNLSISEIKYNKISNALLPSMEESLGLDDPDIIFNGTLEDTSTYFNVKPDLLIDKEEYIINIGENEYTVVAHADSSGAYIDDIYINHPKFVINSSYRDLAIYIPSDNIDFPVNFQIKKNKYNKINNKLIPSIEEMRINERIILPETVVELTIDENNEYSTVELPSFRLKDNYKYKVIHNGKEYLNLIAKERDIEPNQYGDVITWIGNIKPVESFNASSDEPFGICCLFNSANEYECHPYLIDYSKAATATLSIVEVKEDKIPNRLLPSINNMMIETKTILPHTNIRKNETYPLEVSLTEPLELNSEYKIILGGEEYFVNNITSYTINSEVFLFMGRSSSVVNIYENSGHPFVIWSKQGSLSAFVAFDNDKHFSFSIEKIINKNDRIDKNFLPKYQELLNDEVILFNGKVTNDNNGCLGDNFLLKNRFDLKYIVRYKGIEYECETIIYDNKTGIGPKDIDNLFFLYSDTDDLTYIYFLDGSTEAELTIKIVNNKIIDKKNLPSITSILSKNEDILTNYYVEYDNTIPYGTTEYGLLGYRSATLPEIDLIENEEYIVTYNGIEYKCKCISQLIGICLGDSINDYAQYKGKYPFVIYKLNSTPVSYVIGARRAEDKSAIISIRRVTDKIEKIPAQYLDVAEPLVGTTEELTPTIVKEAISANRPITITHTTEEYGDVIVTSINYYEMTNEVIASTTVWFNNNPVLFELYGNCTSDYWDMTTAILSNRENTPTANEVSQMISDAFSSIDPTLDYIPNSQKGNANGVAELDSNGKVPTSQLPSYVDDVIEASSKSAFPATGESGKIYVDLATNKTYRWSGSAYTEISASLAIGTTASTAAAGNHGHDNATTSKSGFMSTTDKSKLDGIEAGANKITVDSSLSSTSTNPVQNKVIQAALDEKANLSQGTFFIEGTGTTNSDSKTSTWTGTCDSITSYYDGLAIRYKIGVVGQNTVTLNINNLGAKTIYRFSTTKLTTQFPVGSIITLVYHADLNGGSWMTNDYDANTNTYQRVYESNDNIEYPITTRYNTTDGSSYYAEYGRYTNGVTLNPSTNTITATTFKGDLTGNASSATKDGNGNIITDTYVTNTEFDNLAAVANSGSYNDLTDKPTIPSGAAADKGVDTSISTASTSTNLPTSKAVAAFVEGKGYKTTDNNTTYTFATGDNNGQIKITPSDGTAQNVSIKGLGTAAYTSSSDYATAQSVNNKMDKSNPTGSGSFSMNRLYGSTIGNYSFAEGLYTTASGQGSHSEGLYTTASGQQGSHAEGNRTIASGQASHAEGSNTTAKGQNSHAEGSNTMASGSSSHVEGYAANHGFTISGDANAIIYSTTDTFIKVGYEVNYNGITSTITAIDKENGTFTVDKTLSDIAIDNVEASYLIDRASGQGSHAEGYDTIASGQASHAEGSNTTASEYYSHSEGDNTTASGYSSHSEGFYTTASGYTSHAEGSYTTASGYSSHSEGDNTTASGQNSHAEGSDTTASGYASHSEGDNTIASGDHGSHAEGYNTTASGDYGSHAEGYQTIANGDASHAEGQGTIASGPLSHVQGNYNIEDTSGKYAHIVGNGHSNNNRSNAHTLDWNGNAWFKGNLKIGGTSQDDTNAKVIATIDNIPTKTSDLTNDSGFITNVDSSLSSTSTNPVQNKVVNSVLSDKVDKTTTINGHALSENVTITKSDVNLSNVVNTGDSATPVSGGTTKFTTGGAYTELNKKVDKISGKGLSTNDYTTEEKNKLAGIDTGANKTIVDSSLSSSSTNPVQNKVINSALNDKMNESNPTGTGSFSMNRKANSTVGDRSFAEGYYTTASGDFSHAEGNNTIASGESSHAEGLCSSNPFTISGDANATIYNTTNTSIKVGQVVIYNNITSTITAIDKENGTFTVDKTLSDTAIDSVNATYKVGGASGEISHTEGYNTTASGYTSHAEGSYTTASGYSSHAEGYDTTASGYSSHAEGYDTISSGSYSHAEGSDTIASGSYSHAEGRDTIASGIYSHVQGIYNIEDTNNKYAHIVGNGTNNSTRSNAHTLDWNGNAWFNGELKIGGTSQDDTNAKKIATEAYVNEQISAALGSIESALAAI